MSNFIDSPRMTMTYENTSSKWCCERCVFGRGEHSDWCPRAQRLNADRFLCDDFLQRHTPAPKTVLGIPVRVDPAMPSGEVKLGSWSKAPTASGLAEAADLCSDGERHCMCYTNGEGDCCFCNAVLTSRPGTFVFDLTDPTQKALTDHMRLR